MAHTFTSSDLMKLPLEVLVHHIVPLIGCVKETESDKINHWLVLLLLLNLLFKSSTFWTRFSICNNLIN